MHASKRIRMCFACNTFIALNHIFERPKNERRNERTENDCVQRILDWFLHSFRCSYCKLWEILYFNPMVFLIVNENGSERARTRGRDRERKMRRSIRFKSMNLEIPIIHAMKYDDKPKYAYRWSCGTATADILTQSFSHWKIYSEPMNCLCICVSIAFYQSASLYRSLSLSLGWIHKFIYEFDNITTEI